jgi:hypothetical protein
VAEGEVFNQEHRHTSLIATLREAWALGEPLTGRDAAARTFAHALTQDTPPRPGHLAGARGVSGRPASRKPACVWPLHLTTREGWSGPRRARTRILSMKSKACRWRGLAFRWVAMATLTTRM